MSFLSKSTLAVWSLFILLAVSATGQQDMNDDALQIRAIYDLALNMIRLSGLKFPSEIDIKITGLRPGEKIYEELLADGENTSPTYHDKIMIAKVKKLDSVKIKQKIEDLCIFNNGLDYNETVKKMKEIVPEFISNNSKYQRLDA